MLFREEKEEQKMTTERLPQSEFFISEAINKSQEIYVFAVDGEQRLLYANDLYRTATGLDLVCGEVFPSEKIFRQTDSSDEVVLLAKDAKQILLKFNCFPQKDESGKIVAFVSIAHNISATVKMKHALDLQHGIFENT